MDADELENEVMASWGTILLLCNQSGDYDRQSWLKASETGRGASCGRSQSLTFISVMKSPHVSVAIES
jgi:hypothetical protein